MYEWRNIWTHGLPNEAPFPISGRWIAEDGMRFSWRWNGSTIPLNLGVIWRKVGVIMLDERNPLELVHQ